MRYGPLAAMPPQAIRLFGEQLTPVVSPWLLKGGTTRWPSPPTWRSSP